MRNNVLFVAIAGLLSSQAPGARAIDPIDSLDLPKKLGRRYQSPGDNEASSSLRGSGGASSYPPPTTTTTDGRDPEMDRSITEAITSFASLNRNVAETERRSRVTSFVKSLAWADFSPEVIAEAESTLNSTVETVDALDVDRFTGRWFQVYSSYTVETLLERKEACVTADYDLSEDDTIAVVSTARTKGVDGNLVQMKGYAYSMDDTEPGQLMVHLDGVSVDAPYWVLALGDKDGTGPYPWAIVSDPFRAFLFVLVRDPEAFSGNSPEEEGLVKVCKDLGFTGVWNSPRETVQKGCTYTDINETLVNKAPAKAENNSPSGLGRLPHSDCQLIWYFPKSNCDEVKKKIVAAIKRTEECIWGNKCGSSTISIEPESGTEVSVDDPSWRTHTVEKDEDFVAIGLNNLGSSCLAGGYPTSQTSNTILGRTIYCMHHNIVEATGLEYKESDPYHAACTQYHPADCERY